MTKKEKIILKVLGEVILRVRLERNLTIRTLAQKSEVAHTTIWRIEKGAISPMFVTLYQIAKALDTTLPAMLLEVEENLMDYSNDD